MPLTLTHCLMEHIQTIDEQLTFPEGPAVDRLGRLWIVDKEAGALLCYEVKNEGAHLELLSKARYEVGGQPNGIAFSNEGILHYADAQLGTVFKLLLHTREQKEQWEKVPLLPIGTMDGPNDLVFDNEGNLFITAPTQDADSKNGCVYLVSKKGEFKLLAEGLHYPNGIILTKSCELIIAETGKNRLLKGIWNTNNCTVSQLNPYYQLEGGLGPDGMCADAVGNLYVAHFGKGCIEIITTKGEIHHLSIPGMNPTNCCFIDNWLIITEAEQGKVLAYLNSVKGSSLFHH